MAAKSKSWLGEFWRPLAALLLWVLGMVPLIAAPPLLSSVVETRIGGLTAFPVDCIPAAPLFPSDLTRACGPPLYDVASECSVAANSGPTRVLIDSNMVPRIAKDPTLGGRLLPGEVPMVSYVTRPELQGAVGRSLRGIPRALDDLPVLGTRPSLDLRIQIRGQLPVARGRFGDGIIGGQAIEGGIPLITDDKALRAAVQAAGGVAR